MIKFLLCLINGHDYERISHKSIPPSVIRLKSENGDAPEFLQMSTIGYTKTIQVCKKCGNIKTTTTLGV